MLTALVVGPVAAERQRVATVLLRGGWSVGQAAGARAAQRATAKLHPDLVVVASELRDGDGLELATRLRRTSRARVLLLVPQGAARVRTAAAALAEGIPCLSSPVVVRELTDFLHGRTTGPTVQENAPGPVRITAERLYAPPQGARLPADGYAGLAPRTTRDSRSELWSHALPYHLAAVARGALAAEAAVAAQATAQATRR